MLGKLASWFPYVDDDISVLANVMSRIYSDVDWLIPYRIPALSCFVLHLRTERLTQEDHPSSVLDESTRRKWRIPRNLYLIYSTLQKIWEYMIKATEASACGVLLK